LGAKIRSNNKCRAPICLYKPEIRDAEIVSSDVCVEEYIPLGRPIPSAPSSRATTHMQHSDIQHPYHKTKGDLECLRQTKPSQDQRSVHKVAETCVQMVNKQMTDKDQHRGDI